MPENSECLVEFADNLAERYGGPAIRIVVFVTNEDGAVEPKQVARYPRLVCRIGKTYAAAHTALEDWNKFLVVDEQEPIPYRLFLRTPHGLIEQPIGASQIPEAVNVARLLGVEQCLALRNEADLLTGSDSLSAFSTTYAGRDQAAVQGALVYAYACARSEGVELGLRRSIVRASRSVEYPVIRPVRAVFDSEESTLREIVGSRPVLLISDLNVGTLYGAAWRRYAQQRFNLIGEVLLDLSEQSKVWDQDHDICGFAIRSGLPRDGVIAGIGGGVTLDTAGMAASVFRRGIDYVRIPTTLVALVDVSVGIKQGVNAHGKKNLIGTFYPPLASINDYRFLKTLLPREISCGMAEIVKVALLRDSALLKLLELHGGELLQSKFTSPAGAAREVGLRAELLMMEELAPNLFEESLARLVDFGHTFSPAIETNSHFGIPHGFAVSLDMLLSTSLAVARGIAPAALLTRLSRLLEKLGLPLWDERMPDGITLLNSLDDVKRHRGGSLNLVVIARPGSAQFVQSVSLRELDSALALMRKGAGSRDDEAAGKPGLAAYARTSV
ncbi:MAG: hypothetical protein M3Y72_01580 [Acidobacteriota bacterium]|nr:hypothetical protein [Acidobacteriota bacterium]